MKHFTPELKELMEYIKPSLKQSTTDKFQVFAYNGSDISDKWSSALSSYNLPRTVTAIRVNNYMFDLTIDRNKNIIGIKIFKETEL